MNLPFTFNTTHHFKAIENSYSKTYDVYFNNFNILLKTVCHWEKDLLQPRIFSNQTFFVIKDYSFPL